MSFNMPRHVLFVFVPSDFLNKSYLLCFSVPLIVTEYQEIGLIECQKFGPSHRLVSNQKHVLPSETLAMTCDDLDVGILVPHAFRCVLISNKADYECVPYPDNLWRSSISL